MCSSCGPERAPDTEETVGLLPVAPPSLGAAGTLLPQLSLQADCGGQSQTHQLRRTPNIPSAPHGSNGAVSFQEALEGTDQSTRTEGSGVSCGAAFRPAGFTPLFGKLIWGAHPDPPWPLFLLSPDPGKPQIGKPQITQPLQPAPSAARGEDSLGSPYTRHHNLSGLPTACKHPSSTVHEGDPSLLWPQPHHTHMFTWMRTHVFTRVRTHIHTCLDRHTHA